MDSIPLYPLQAEQDCLLKHCRLPLHVGKATIASQLDRDGTHPLEIIYKRLNPDAPELPDVEFDAAFFMPATGNCQIFLQCRDDFRLYRTFGTDLVVTGTSDDGLFKLQCKYFYVNAEGEGPAGRRWAIAHPVNQPAELTFGDARSISRVSALINNFDFDTGNEPKDSGQRHILRVRAAGKVVEFVHRDGHEQLRTLLTIGVLGPAALARLSFDAWTDSTEKELTDFAFDVAGLCGIVARQHTGVPIISLLDADDRPIKHLLIDALESSFRKNYVVRHLQLDRGLPNIFEQCFENYQRMNSSDLWRPLSGYCKSIEDATYMEQKTAMMFAGLERLMRNALVEAKCCSKKEAEKKMLTDLLGAVKKQLGWDIPSHYTARDQVRSLRNAVAHGGELPQSTKQVRHDLDKWSLFLLRRVLMELGFDGEIDCPDIEAGQMSVSAVNDFSERHNSWEIKPAKKAGPA